MAWVEYESDLARDMAIERLDRTAPAAARVRVAQASTRADWEALRAQVETQTGLVHVTFSGAIGSPAIPQRELGEFALAMNLDREPVFAIPCQQVWWLRKELAAAMQHRAPDFVSWVHLRLALEEKPVNPERPESFGRVWWQGIEPTFAVRQSTAGAAEVSKRSQKQVDAARVAVYQARRLAVTNPEVGRPELTNRLMKLAGFLMDAGRREEALLVARDAADLFRQLFQANQEEFRSGMAGSLLRLSACLTDMGRREEALVTDQEAVTLYRQLAESNRGGFLPGLARGLNSFAVSLADMGRRDEALAAIREAVDVYRQLAAAQPDAFRPDLAMSLNNLANMLSAVGQRDEALAAIREAVDVYRQLAAAQPDAFRPYLARSQGTLGRVLATFGRPAEAAAAFADGLRAILPFAARYPEALPDLGTVLFSGYTSALQEARLEPDPELVGEAARILGPQPHPDR
jgi:tetratricopeptide (TPR) repeat protein